MRLRQVDQVIWTIVATTAFHAPGTTADLVTAALYAALCDGTIKIIPVASTFES